MNTINYKQHRKNPLHQNLKNKPMTHEVSSLSLEKTRKKVKLWILDVGRGFLFFKDSFQSFFKKPYRFSELIQSIEFIGNKSFLVIALSSSFTGMALAYQIYLGFLTVGTTGLVGSIVALSIFKELGPVLTGIILSARAGGAMAAQLGNMKISEQLDALEVMGIDSKQYLVGPKIIASIIATPLLCGVFNFISIFSAYFFSIHAINLDPSIFWNKIKLLVYPEDIFGGLFKASMFGLIFSSICSYKGFFAKKGAKGVGEATNKGVVYSMICIILIDFFLTRILRLFYVFMNET